MKNSDTKNAYLKIGGLAESCDVSVSTVLYYQRIGLFPEPRKPKHGGYRIYNESHVDQLRQIKNAQQYGFSLKEIQTILLNRETANCKLVKSVINQRISKLQGQILTLNEAWQKLVNLAGCCDGECINGECPLFKKLGSLDS